jgi:hypothetical protein
MAKMPADIHPARVDYVVADRRSRSRCRRSHQTDDDQRDRGTTVLHSLDQVKQLLLSRGVSPEQFGRALMEPMPPMIEQAEKDNGQDAG